MVAGVGGRVVAGRSVQRQKKPSPTSAEMLLSSQRNTKQTDHGAACFVSHLRAWTAAPASKMLPAEHGTSLHPAPP